jgi:hypothetical protein
LSKPHAGPKLRCTRLPANQMDQSLNIVIVDESAIRAAMPPPKVLAVSAQWASCLEPLVPALSRAAS